MRCFVSVSFVLICISSTFADTVNITSQRDGVIFHQLTANQQSLTIPVDFAIPLQAAVRLSFVVTAPHSQINVTHAGGLQTFSNDQLTQTHSLYVAAPVAQVTVAISRDDFTSPCSANISWHGVSLAPKHVYAADLSKQLPSWIPFAGAMGAYARGALRVSFPAGEDLCISQPEHSVDIETDVMVYNGNSVTAPYIGKLEDFLGCQRTRRIPIPGNEFTMVSPTDLMQSWLSPVFTLKSVLDRYSINETRPHLMNGLKYATLNVRSVGTLMMGQTILQSTDVTLSDITFKDQNSSLQVWCGGLLDVDTAGNNMIAELTPSNLAAYTYDGAMHLNCAAVTLRSSNGQLIHVNLTMHNNLNVNNELVIKKGARGVFVNPSYPWQDEQTSTLDQLYSYGFLIASEQHETNLLTDLRFSSMIAGQLTNVQVVNRDIRKYQYYKNMTVDEVPACLQTDGYQTIIYVDGDTVRFRVDYDVVDLGKNGALGRLSLLVVAIFVMLC